MIQTPTIAEVTFSSSVAYLPEDAKRIKTAHSELNGDYRALAVQYPEALFPYVLFDSPTLIDSQLLAETREINNGEIPSSLLGFCEGFGWGVRVLVDLRCWLRPSSEPDSAELILRSKRVSVMIEGVRFDLPYDEHYSNAVEKLRREGGVVTPLFDFEMQIHDYHVPVWRDVTVKKRWSLWRLSSDGEPIGWVAVNGADIVVEF